MPSEPPAFFDELPPTPQGIEFRAALLVKYFREAADEDQAYLLRVAEQLSARNRR